MSAAISAEVLDSCLSTLLDNAASHGAGAAVQIDVAADAMHIDIAVRDDGPGISEANAERLFTPFFTTGRAQGHTGLGLCIARALLRAHGGELRLATPKPARFVLRLKRA